MINFEKKIYYCHINKCGGTSLKSQVSDLFPTLDSKEPGLQDHSSVSEIKEYLGGDFEKFKGLAIVRNPYFRCVSYYNHIKRSNSWLFKEFSKISDISSFSKFVSSLPVFINKFEGNEWGDKSIWPQARWLEVDGKIVTQEIIKLEDYHNSSSQLSSFFGRKIDTQVVKNARPMVHNLFSSYDKQLGSETRSSIYDIYKIDFETFGYSE